jgi:hypothetical protein
MNDKQSRVARPRERLRHIQVGANLHRFVRLILGWLIVSGPLCNQTQAQGRVQTMRPASPPRIVFLHLRASPRGFEVIDTKIASGSLKSSPYEPGKEGLHFQLLGGANGPVLFQNICPEPTVRRLEYEDPNSPGRLIAKQVISETAEFTIRVPYVAGTQKLRFYRSAGNDAVGVMAGPKRRELIVAGEVNLVLPAP